MIGFWKKAEIRGFGGSQSGIALMIVLAAITLLTSIATEFAYSTNVNYHLALNDKERMQAYFLAQSSIKLMELELKLEKQLRSSVSASSAADTVAANLSGPLCQQMPLSTSGIRTMFLGETPAPGTGEEGKPTAAFISGLQVDAAKGFLNFEGDFDGMCEDESAKFNLNMFIGKNPAQETLSGLNDYDRAKRLLMTILGQPGLKDLFLDDAERKVREIPRNIADWVDENDRINELGGTSTGSESSLYKGAQTSYNVKNGKYLTLDELYLVAGVDDDWFIPIKNMFTIYGGDKVNVCMASDEVISALILQYAGSNPNVPTLNPEDKEKMTNLISVVKNGCTGVTPDVNAIASALDVALGVQAAGAAAAGTSPGVSTGSFASMITTESRYYTLVGTGIVGDTEVKVRTVLDTKDPYPARWKFVYWRIE